MKTLQHLLTIIQLMQQSTLVTKPALFQNPKCCVKMVGMEGTTSGSEMDHHSKVTTADPNLRPTTSECMSVIHTFTTEQQWPTLLIEYCPLVSIYYYNIIQSVSLLP